MVVTASTLFIKSSSSSSTSVGMTTSETASPTLLGLLLSLPVPMASPHPPLVMRDVMLERRWVK